MAFIAANSASNAAWFGDSQRIQTLLAVPGAAALCCAPDSRGYTPLHYAASMGNHEILNTILTAPQALGSGLVDVRDARMGNTPLIQAALDGQEEAAMSLVDFGADVNVQNFEGATALLIAAKRGMGSLVGFLLENGASSQISDLDGTSPLHAAVTSGNAQALLELVDHGAWLNAPDNEGDTPLHWCVREGRVELLKLLVRRGADIFTKNEDGETAYDLACELNEHAMVQVLAVTAAVAASLSASASASANSVGEEMDTDDGMDVDEDEEPEEQTAVEAALMAMGAGEKAEWSAWTKQHPQQQSQLGGIPLNMPLSAQPRAASYYY